VVDRDEGKKNENVGGGLRGDEGVAEKEAQGAAPFGGRSGGGMMRSPPGLLATPRPSSAAGASGESRGPRPPRVPGPARHGWRERREQDRCCPAHGGERERERGGGDGSEPTLPSGFTAPGRMPPPRTSFAAGAGEAVADPVAATEEAAQ